MFGCAVGLNNLLYQSKHFVGHVPEGEVNPCAGSHYRAVVREYAEALFTVVSAHARVAHSTEGDVLVGNVHDGVIDAGSAR